MSYDLYLRDRVSRERLEVPGHLMYGGNVRVAPVNGELVPQPTTEAYLNITYNYSSYYYGAFPGVKDDPDQNGKDRAEYGILSKEGGIRSLNGIGGQAAVRVLQEMIRRIEQKYKDVEGWISTEREKEWYEDRKHPEVTKDPLAYFLLSLELRRDGLSEEQAKKHLEERWAHRKSTILVDEGSTRDYWTPTAANAIRPLHQLIALTQLRPDGVWSEES